VALSLGSLVDAWAIGPELSLVRAPGAEVERLLESLLTRLQVEDLYLHTHPAVVAGVGVIILIIGCCVEGIAGWRYSVLVHSYSSSLWAGLHCEITPAGPFLWAFALYTEKYTI